MANKDYTDELVKLFESEDASLFVAPKKSAAPKADDRLSESFLEIIDFVSKNERKPDIEAEDFNEALLAKRLDSIRSTPDKVKALERYDTLGLLDLPEAPKSIEELVEDDPFGIFSGAENEIFNIKHAKQRRVVNPMGEKAKRVRSEDFAEFKPIFVEAQQKLESGENKLVLFSTIDQLHKGGLYVNGGQMVYVAEEGEEEQKAGYVQRRLRVIVENGTESNMYRRSLAQRLYEGGSCVVDVNDVTGEEINPDEDTKGYIYVVRSLSKDNSITSISNLYKIGFSTTPVAKRIANAKDDPTYLMADVELVESYRLTGDYNPQKVEDMIHRVFSSAALEIEVVDKEGKKRKPREWYSVPIHVVREAVDLISSGEIVDYVYDSDNEEMVLIKEKNQS